jgi:hypothetical protein
MSDRPWKKHERQAAAIFGTRRKIGSGCQGRDDATRSDSNHPTLFIECKTRARSAVRSLMNDTAELAKAEGKVPILALRETGKPGAVWCVRQQDLDAMVVAYAAANHARLWPLIVRAINDGDGIEPGDFGLPREEEAC